jgi:hypothetical protein
MNYPHPHLGSAPSPGINTACDAPRGVTVEDQYERGRDLAAHLNDIEQRLLGVRNALRLGPLDNAKEPVTPEPCDLVGRLAGVVAFSRDRAQRIDYLVREIESALFNTSMGGPAAQLEARAGRG